MQSGTAGEKIKEYQLSIVALIIIRIYFDLRGKLALNLFSLLFLPRRTIDLDNYMLQDREGGAIGGGGGGANSQVGVAPQAPPTPGDHGFLDPIAVAVQQGAGINLQSFLQQQGAMGAAQRELNFPR